MLAISSDLQSNILEDVQGNILKGFNKPNLSLLFFRFDNSLFCIKWLENLAQKQQSQDLMTSSEMVIPSTQDLIDTSTEILKGRKPRQNWLHISLSYLGIEALKLQPPLSGGTLKDDPFKLGMKYGAGILEDVGKSAPEKWIKPFKKKIDSDGNNVSAKIHALFIVAFDDAIETKTRRQIIQLKREAKRNGAICLHEEKGKAIFRRGRDDKKKHQVEHFGFHDGISQPLIEGIDEQDIKGRRTYTDMLKPDNFILTGISLPKKQQWAANGSFLVFRRLRQDVPAFWDFMRKKSICLDMGQEELAAKFMGRWKSGAPLSRGQQTDPGIISSEENDFSYEDDPDGNVTPMFSHIRKVNPRNAVENTNDHRILRRGIPYGHRWKQNNWSDRKDRGLLFICYQRNIVNQFEYVQRHWISDENFPPRPISSSPTTTPISRFMRPGVDPIAANYSPSRDPVYLLHNEQALKIKIKQWVTTTGGEYFFSPSISALKTLSKKRH